MDNDLFADAARQLLGGECTPAVVRAIEAGGLGAPQAQALWAQIEAAGLADALLDEAEGGAGLGLSQLFGVLEQAGAHALPLPLGDTLLARALLAQAGMARPAGAIALAAWFSRWNRLVETELEDEPASVIGQVSWLGPMLA